MIHLDFSDCTCAGKVEAFHPLHGNYGIERGFIN